jgi:hypothetical protein
MMDGLQLFGWTRTAELINGRVAMLGFVVGALSEILTQSSLLAQLADHPRVSISGRLHCC